MFDHMLAQPAPTAKSQANKRRNSKATKSPVVFPNLRDPQNVTQMKAQLASIAVNALQIATDELGAQEMADENMSHSDEEVMFLAAISPY